VSAERAGFAPLRRQVVVYAPAIVPLTSVLDVYCPRCHAALEPRDRRCWACGRRLGPSITRPAFFTIVIGVLTAVLVVGVQRLWAAAEERGNSESKSHSTTTVTAPPATTAAAPAPAATAAPPPPGPVTATVQASSATGPAQNGCGQTTTYDPANVVDGDKSTAWRTAGDGTGQSLQLTLPANTHLVQVGLIPGYDKIDDCSGADRFAQMRKVTGVKWTFADGRSVTQTFTPDRTMQLMNVDVVTTSVLVEITGTTGASGLDYTPVSEVSLIGYPA
jgi:hypothetical protein